MKYIYIAIALIFVGCSQKTPDAEKPIEAKVKSKVAEVTKTTEIAKAVETTNAVEVQEEVGTAVEAVTIEEKVPAVETHALKSNETIIDEPKVTKRVASDVPTSCAMWSDGANICTRISKRKASCTTNPITHRMVSCLQWQ